MGQNPTSVNVKRHSYSMPRPRQSITVLTLRWIFFLLLGARECVVPRRSGFYRYNHTLPFESRGRRVITLVVPSRQSVGHVAQRGILERILESAWQSVTTRRVRALVIKVDVRSPSLCCRNSNDFVTAERRRVQKVWGRWW
jgi:hypothetical protein